MKIGRLRHQIQVFRYEEKQDEYGEPIKTYEFYSKAYAEIRPLTGREPFDEKMFITEQTHKIYMRWMRGLESTMRLVWHDAYEGRDRMFEIIGNPINHMEKSKLTMFNAKEMFNHDIPHPLNTICSNSVGGRTGIDFKISGAWIEDCVIFKQT